MNTNRVISGGMPIQRIDDGELEKRIARIRENNAEMLRKREVGSKVFLVINST